MSVHFWGEDPRGSWTLSVTDNAHNNRQHHRYKTRFGDTEDVTHFKMKSTVNNNPVKMNLKQPKISRITSSKILLSKRNQNMIRRQMTLNEFEKRMKR